MRHTFLNGLFATIAVALHSAGADAATLIVEGGELVGAHDVIVQGESYDVTFIDGTCVDLYDGCDEQADFTFTYLNPAQALAARAALLDQVMIGIYDTQPEATRGCAAEAWCNLAFPIQKLGAPDGIGVAYAINDEDEIEDLATGSGGGSISLDLSNVDVSTYVVWSGPLQAPAVPTGAWGAMALALSGLGTGWRALARARVDGNRDGPSR